MPAYGEHQQAPGEPIGSFDNETGEMKWASRPRHSVIYAPRVREPGFDKESLIKGAATLLGILIIVFGVYKIFDGAVENQNWGRCTSALCDDIARADAQSRVNQAAARAPQPIVVPGTPAAPARSLAPTPSVTPIYGKAGGAKTAACLEGLGLQKDKDFFVTELDGGVAKIDFRAGLRAEITANGKKPAVDACF